MLKITVVFQCPACGLLTPGLAKVPDTVPAEQPVRFIHECCHCDRALSRVASVAQLIEETGGAE